MDFFWLVVYKTSLLNNLLQNWCCRFLNGARSPQKRNAGIFILDFPMSSTRPPSKLHQLQKSVPNRILFINEKKHRKRKNLFQLSPCDIKFFSFPFFVIHFISCSLICYDFFCSTPAFEKACWLSTRWSCYYLWRL